MLEVEPPGVSHFGAPVRAGPRKAPVGGMGDTEAGPSRVDFFGKTKKGERCGKCKTCLNPHMKQACLTLRARQEKELEEESAQVRAKSYIKNCRDSDFVRETSLEKTLADLIGDKGAVKGPSQCKRLVELCADADTVQARHLLLRVITQSKRMPKSQAKFMELGLLRVLRRWVIDAVENDYVSTLRAVLKCAATLEVTESAIRESKMGKELRRLVKHASGEVVQLADEVMKCWMDRLRAAESAEREESMPLQPPAAAAAGRDVSRGGVQGQVKAVSTVGSKRVRPGEHRPLSIDGPAWGNKARRTNAARREGATRTGPSPAAVPAATTSEAKPIKSEPRKADPAAAKPAAAAPPPAPLKRPHRPAPPPPPPPAEAPRAEPAAEPSKPLPPPAKPKKPKKRVTWQQDDYLTSVRVFARTDPVCQVKVGDSNGLPEFEGADRAEGEQGGKLQQSKDHLAARQEAQLEREAMRKRRAEQDRERKRHRERLERFEVPEMAWSKPREVIVPAHLAAQEDTPAGFGEGSTERDEQNRRLMPMKRPTRKEIREMRSPNEPRPEPAAALQVQDKSLVGLLSNPKLLASLAALASQSEQQKQQQAQVGALPVGGMTAQLPLPQVSSPPPQPLVSLPMQAHTPQRVHLPTQNQPVVPPRSFAPIPATSMQQAAFTQPPVSLGTTPIMHVPPAPHTGAGGLGQGIVGMGSTMPVTSMPVMASLPTQRGTTGGMAAAGTGLVAPMQSMGSSVGFTQPPPSTGRGTGGMMQASTMPQVSQVGWQGARAPMNQPPPGPQEYWRGGQAPAPTPFPPSRDPGRPRDRAPGLTGQWGPKRPNTPCAFFNTPKGCKHGDNCKFLHIQSARGPSYRR